MLKEHASFSSMRKRINDGEKEIINFKNRFLQLELTPAEKIRFEENNQLAKVLYEEFRALIDGKIDLELIEKRSQALMKNLNPAQQKLLQKITASLLGKNLPFLEGFPSKHTPETLREKYQKGGQFQAYLYFSAGVSDSILQKIKPGDVKLMPWGAVVVRVNDEAAWKELRLERKSDTEKAQGYFTPNKIFNRQVRSSVNEYPYINAQFKRTVFIRNFGLTQKQSEEIEKHELFHELYENVFSPHQKINYPHYHEKTLFGEIKNELIAYLLSKDWQYDLNSLSPSIRVETEQKKQDLNNPNKLFEYLLECRLKEKLARNHPDKFEIVSMIRQSDLALIGEKEKEKEKQATMSFLKEIFYLLREVVRLKYLRSDKFEEATKALLTAQSFKEMRHKLSLLEKDKILDPAKSIDLKNIQQENNLREGISFLATATTFRLPVKNMALLVETLKNQKETLESNEKVIDPRLVNLLNKSLTYYEKNSQRILAAD